MFEYIEDLDGKTCRYDENDSWLTLNGDCMSVLSSFADSSIDCVITDPPYFIDGMGDEWDAEGLNEKKKKAGVVGSLPVGMKFDPRQGERLQEFYEPLSREIYRVLKPGGFFLSFSQPRLVHRMAVAVEDAGFEIRDMIVWHRSGQGKAFSQDHFVRKNKNLTESEKARIISTLHGRKTPQLKGDFEPVVLAQKPKEGTFIENWMEYGVGLIDYTQSLGDGTVPSNVMYVPKPGKDEKTSHLTVKPVKLIEHMIRVFTKEGDTVLDPFLGSGTTVAAAVSTGRTGIGIELDGQYYKEAVKKIERYAQQAKEEAAAQAKDGTKKGPAE